MKSSSSSLERNLPMLPHRRRLLLAMLQEFDCYLPNRDFQKYLMLHEFELAETRSFDFVPYKFGGFSFQSYADRRSLVSAGLLVDSDDWQLSTTYDFLGKLRPIRRRNLKTLRCNYGNLKGRDLVRELYRRFPYYAIRSEIAQDVMDRDELAAIEKAKPTDDTECLFTIGYEGISIDTYLNRLVLNNVKVLCDVRRNPLSRKYGFSKSKLRDATGRLDIRYVHIPELGISSDKRQTLTTARDYQRLFAQYERTTLRKANNAVAQVSTLLAAHRRVALTCFEADADMCHRGRVVKALIACPQPPAAIRHL